MGKKAETPKLETIDPGLVDRAMSESENPENALETVFVEIQKVAQKNWQILDGLKRGTDDDLAVDLSMLVKQAENDYIAAFLRLEHKFRQYRMKPEDIRKLEDLKGSLMSKLEKLVVDYKNLSLFLKSPAGKAWLEANEGKILLNLGEKDVIRLSSKDEAGQAGVDQYLDAVLTDDRKVDNAGKTVLVVAGGVVVGVVVGAAIVGTGGAAVGAALAAAETAGTGIAAAGLGETLAYTTVGVLAGGAVGAEVGGVAGGVVGGLSAAGYEISNGVISFEDVVGEKDPVTGLHYSEEDTFALMKGMAESMALDTKDWKVRDGVVLSGLNDYIAYLMKYEKDGARDDGNIGKVDVVDATAKYIGVQTDEFRGVDEAVWAAMETVFGRDKVKNGDEVKGTLIAKLEGQILGRLAAASKRFQASPEKFKAYKNYVFFKLNNLPKEKPDLDKIADYILPPSMWENEVMEYVAKNS